MQVIWHGFGLSNPYSGIFRYALLLSKNLPQDVQLIVCGSEHQLSRWNGERLPISTWIERIAANFGIASLPQLPEPGITSPQPKIFHGLSNFNVPFTKSSRHWRKVLTIHDTIPLLPDSGLSLGAQMRMRLAMPRAIDASDKIICVSEWSKRQVCQLFPSAIGKVQVIYNGRDGTERFTSADAPSQDSKYRMGTPRILMVARGESYKRLSLFATIFWKLRRDFQFHIVTDVRGAHQLSLEAQAGMIIHVGLSAHQLGKLMQECSCYVQTSLYEGFCLPAVEAMQHGLGIVYQRGSAMDEVVGDAGIGMATHASPDQWVAAVAETSSWTTDANRSAEIRSQYAKLPLWSETAQQVFGVYRDLIA